MPKKKQKTTKKETKMYRPPIVTLMGHVDHGKTSLLDAIRETQLTAKEAGGITQHTAAYTVEKDGQKITFIDTPGHEAFTEMRARGGKAADIVILVVAADDGVMPQTKEAIMHAKVANVPIIVAINKIDLANADVNKVKRQLSENDILVEGYGGDIVTVEVSALTKKGIDELLDVINLTAEMNKEMLEADANGKLEALIIESIKNSKKGILANAIVKNGTLRVRDDIVTENQEARIKSITDSFGKSLKEAIPGDAVEILGFSEMPHVGDIIMRKSEVDLEKLKKQSDQAEKIQEQTENSPETKKVLNIIIRADTTGTQEALISSIKKINVEDAMPKVVFAGTGDIKESDVLLAQSSKAIIFAFNVKASKSMKELALSKKVLIREHTIIYHLLEEIEEALEGVLEIEESKIRGRGLVIEKFTLPKSQMLVIGVLVEAGSFKVRDRIGIYRDENMDVPVHASKIRSLHIGPKEVEKATKGEEVGILLKPQIDDIQLDDIIEVL